MFADDIILLSITVTDLQHMFDICAKLFKELDLPINVSKCHCMRIGPRSLNFCSNLTIHGITINWVEDITFLGVKFCNSKTFKCNWDDVKKTFYCRTNIILGRLSTSAPANVLLKLINAHAVPNLLYGISATSLSENETKCFSHAYNSIFAKIFKTFDNNVITNCQYFSGYLPFEMLYDLQRYKFLHKLHKTACLTDKSVIDRNDYRDFLLLQFKYAFSLNDSDLVVKHKVWRSFKNRIDSIN